MSPPKTPKAELQMSGSKASGIPGFFCLPETHDGSMGLVYLPTLIVDFYGINVGKYTIHGSYGKLKARTCTLPETNMPFRT